MDYQSLYNHVIWVYYLSLLCRSNRVLTFSCNTSIAVCILARTITSVMKPNRMGHAVLITSVMLIGCSLLLVIYLSNTKNTFRPIFNIWVGVAIFKTTYGGPFFVFWCGVLFTFQAYGGYGILYCTAGS